jgi:GTPase SAR1 family protein
MSDQHFPYDVFLSHSSKDTAVVRSIAERMAADGLSVCLADWEIRPGDSIPDRTEEGLEGSRVLVLCMTANAFGPEWSTLESQTLRFRDPLNGTRRFVPLRLDDVPVQGSLARYRFIDWQAQDREEAYAQLLRACSEALPSPAGRTAPLDRGPYGQGGVLYTNAKVMLVGDSGAGKTGLSMRLATGEWEPSASTLGAWATQWKVPADLSDGVERELWLWDFGGQADQRLVHQLFMEDAALAVLVFDGQRDDVLETLDQWDRDLTQLSSPTISKLLVAGRVDAGGLRVSRSQIEDLARQRGYLAFLETSAKTGLGCDQLMRAILDGIRWDEIPWRSTPLFFKRLMDEIVRLRDEGWALVRFNELRQILALRMSGDEVPFLGDRELRAAVGLLSGPGIVWELKFGSWVLLHPERIHAYANAMIQTIRADEHERGCLAEERVLNGDLLYLSSMDRLPPEEERFVLLALHQTLVERGLCMREHTEAGTLLVFPSYYRRERPELAGHPTAIVSYRFNGFLDGIYAALVVRLHHTSRFQQEKLWRNAADFKTLTGKLIGMKLTRRAEGTGELLVYCDPGVEIGEMILFSKYVHEHLLQHARDVVRLRQYICPHCGTPVGNREVAMRRLQEGRQDIVCINCEERIPLWDELEELSASEEVRGRVRGLQKEVDIVLDTESKERVLVGEVISTVALAGQVCRELPVSDHGIDMEVEFTNDVGEATGQKVYLALEAGDSFLPRESERGKVVTVSERRTRYWQSLKHPVLLVASDAEGQLRWMEMGEALSRSTMHGTPPVRSLTFEGQRFDVMSVRRLRDTMLQDNRQLLLQRAAYAPDERARCVAVRKLITWPDRQMRDFLLDLAEKDESVEIRCACYEALSEGWWKEWEVRRLLRSVIADETEPEIAERLTRIAEGARSRLSGQWEAKLCGSAEPVPEALPGYPTFRVSRFRLRDVGPFHDTGEVELRSDVNVFLGDNAAGKSTILRCLALAAVGLAAANEVEDDAGAYLRRGARRGTIEVLFELVPDQDALPGESGYFGVGLQITAGSSRFAALPDRDMTLRVPGQDSRKLFNSAEPLGSLRSASPSQFGFVAGYGAVRTFSESRLAAQTELKKPENEWVLSLFKADAWLVHPEVFTNLVRGDTSTIEDAPPGGLSPGVVNSLRTTLERLFPDVTTFFGQGESDLQLNGTPLRFGDLSDGYRSLFALMGHLLRCSVRAYGWSVVPSQVDGIVLIDEMDLHLHPTWQHHVVEDFNAAFQKTQLIASTHSPLVVGALKREHVLILGRDNDGRVTVDHPDLDPQGLGVAGVLTSIFDLGSTIDQPTLDKINRRLLLHAKRGSWTEAETREYARLSGELARLGFNREFSDPYFERFATAMAKRHRAKLEKLTPREKIELDEYAQRLLADLTGGGDE